MDRLIEVKVRGNHLTKDNDLAGVQHEANVTRLRIDFDEGWDGYAKKVTWWNALGLDPVEITLTANLLEDIAKSTRVYLAPIPGEALTEAGRCTFVIDGYINGKRQRSLSDSLKVKAAPFIDKADQPTDPTPSQAEQLQEQIDALMGEFQGGAIRAEEAVEKAKQAATAAETAKGAAAASAAEAKTAETGAKAAQKAAENARDAARDIAGGNFATLSEARQYAEAAEENAKKYVDEKGVTNPNLLDNWYFARPVNQRGETEYTTTGWVAYYGIDRWFLTAATWDVANRKLTAHDRFGRMVQYIEGTELVGKTVTFSALVRSTSGGSIMLIAGPGDYGLVEEPEGFAGVISTTITVRDPGASINSFSIIVPTTGASVVVEAAKLELGTQQTLAHQDADGNWVLNEIPNYNEQLMKCCTSKAHVPDAYTGKTIIHSGNLAQYLGVVQASLEE